ncbi:deoxyribonuclease II [Oesophagostomum dentatum]|uniref:Deoxyribonuclease II n=1 Tax=Oesophagostomum dentatum TaxID=61180 RepID=A0A0B1T8S5_OESDE|nr:deoxyribonuclease II [Oesophagostomum dentatum]
MFEAFTSKNAAAHLYLCKTYIRLDEECAKYIGAYTAGMFEVGLVVLMLARISSTKTACKNMEGNDVDWFAALKLPPNADNSKGYSFVYFDSTQTEWKKSSELINSRKSAIGVTVDQIYEKSTRKMFKIAYNDDSPIRDAESGRGHSKGVALFDEKNGFWLLHSVPNYPPINRPLEVSVTEKYDYPESGAKYAQSFLCLSLDADVLPEIGQYMRFAQVTPFIANLPDYFKKLAPVLQDVVGKKSLGRSDTIYNITASIKTLEGKKITIFSKHKKSRSDLWHDFIAQNIKAQMAVETWRKGVAKDVGARCDEDKYHVYDINSLTVLGAKYSYSNDHSKWGISLDKKVPVVCIGDINRQESQFKRGGGAVCMKDEKLWKTFYNSIYDYVGCGVKKLKREPSEKWTNFSPKFEFFN